MKYHSIFSEAKQNPKSWAQAGQGLRISLPPVLALGCAPLSSLFPHLVCRQGGVILVSHNERFIHLVCQELWVCENATVTRIEGGFEQYRDILKEQFRKEGFL